jgi:hypothetical protein
MQANCIPSDIEPILDDGDSVVLSDFQLLYHLVENDDRPERLAVGLLMGLYPDGSLVVVKIEVFLYTRSDP